MNHDEELRYKLLDDNELEDIELQKKSSHEIVTGVAVSKPEIVTGVAVSKPPSQKNSKVRKGHSCCCKCMCFTLSIFALGSILALGAGYYFLKDVVEHLTVKTDSPQKFPIVEMSEPELGGVIHRAGIFVNGILDKENNIKDLVIEQDEINGFIGHSNYLRGNLMITFHENRFVEEFSLPMDVLGFGGRYFAGSEDIALKSKEHNQENLIEMKMETEATHEDWFDGPLFFMQLQYLITKNKEDEGQSILELYLKKGSFFGQVVPQEVIDENLGENLLNDLYDADNVEMQDMRDIISGIESVSIEEGKVVFKAREFNSSN